jgi:hypothetical protein
LGVFSSGPVGSEESAFRIVPINLLLSQFIAEHIDALIPTSRDGLVLIEPEIGFLHARGKGMLYSGEADDHRFPVLSFPLDNAT